jgi:hypothetical protein
VAKAGATATGYRAGALNESLQLQFDYTYLDATQPGGGKHEDELRRPRSAAASYGL